MACCSAKRVSGPAWDGLSTSHTFLFEVGAWFAVLLGGGLLVLLTALAASFSAAARARLRPVVRTVGQSLRHRVERVLDTPFLLGASARCRLSGRLYPVSGRLAGAVFRYFNVFVLVVAGVVLGGFVRALMLLIPAA
jgi:hypothetical protein